MPTLKHLPADTQADVIARILDTDGALILDAVIPPDRIAGVMAELGPYIDATPVGRDDFTGFATTRTGALVARSPASRELVMHPAMLAACDAYLLRACDRYQLHLTQVIRIRPGQPRQALHRDRLAWGGFLKGVEPQFNTIWAMTDFTQENGATRTERCTGKFRRSITLPARVDVNKVSATYKDGILRVTLPKAEEAKPKQIQINPS